MIDTFFKILKKSLLMTVMLMFAFAITYVPQIHTDESGQEYAANMEYAHAGASVVVEIGGNLLQNLYTAIQTTIQTVYKAWIWLKENVLDGVAWGLAKRFISNMVADVVDWINSGFEDSPAFVQDLDNFLLRSADEAVGEFINQLGGAGSFVCSPFRLDVQFAVALNWDLDRERNRPECTLSDVVDNIDDFVSGNFQSGGWEGWYEMTANPGNTPYGSILAAQSEANARVVNKKGEELNLLDFGSGFISIPYCEDVDGDEGPVEECSIVKPGDVIRDTLNKSLGSGQDSLVEADEFNEILLALLGGLATQALEGTFGLLGLSGSGDYSYTPYSREVSFVEELRSGEGDVYGGTEGDDVDDSSGSGVNTGLALIQEAVNNLIAMQASLNVYINSADSNQGLNAFANNELNGDVERATAAAFLGEAIIFRDRVNDDLATAEGFLADYTALDDEYAGATPARQLEIEAEQEQIVQNFTRSNLITQEEYDVNADTWDRLLARNVEPPPPIIPIIPGPGPGPLP